MPSSAMWKVDSDMKEKKRYNWLILFMLAIVGVDQLTKILVIKNIPYGEQLPVLPGVVHLTYVRNAGAAFSMLAGARWLFLALVAAFFVVLALMVKKGLLRHPAELWCMAAVAGGALGNAIDRAISGTVVDMIEVEFVRFAVFNVADSFITCGAIAFIVYTLFFAKKREKETPAEKEETHEDPV